MYVSLYRRYRPQNFSDVVGQTSAITVLQQSLNEKRVGHAYLFSGPRGCGKTSVARILAKALNCLNPQEAGEPCCVCANCTAIAAGEHLDVIEIDGASNRGIGEIRDLKSRVNLKPLSALYKIYIIDEVHMLTEQAFNALLKTLEEPPSNVVFILATTEPNKVPVTIRSRCQHIPFHRISMTDLVNRISYICEKEGISAESEAVWEIARQADGALRDALSLTEQAVALGNGHLTMESIKGLLGGSSRTELEQLVTQLRADPSQAALKMHEIFSRGVSVETFLEALFNIYRDLWLYSLWGERSFEAVEASEAEHDYLRKEAGSWTKEQLKAACKFCNGLMPRARYGMKTEIFSGLLLLGLTGIFEKPEDVAPTAQIQPAATVPVQPIAAQPVAAKSTVRTQNSFDTAEVAGKTERQQEQESIDAISEVLNKEVEIPVPPVPQPFRTNDVPYDATELLKQLEGTALGTLVAGIPELQLQFAAALLDAEIERTETGWEFNFPNSKLSENFLKIPRNAALLNEAVSKIYGVKNANAAAAPQTLQDTPKAKKNDDAQAFEQKPQTETQPQKTTNSAAAANPSVDRMLKLMGAETLYVEGQTEEIEEEAEK